MNAQGTVSAVSPVSITVKGKAETMTFMIDKDTSVTAKGATHKKQLALKADGRATYLHRLRENGGDTVTVAYHDMVHDTFPDQRDSRRRGEHRCRYG